jgi:hypothetical protein
MRLIVLMGLVTAEKIELVLELARQHADAGRTVTVIDNVRRLKVDRAGLASVELIRLDGDLRDHLVEVVESMTSDVVLLAVSETARLDDLFVLLNDLRDQLPEVAVQTLALIDTRTCDCFPQFREQLEDYADVVVNLPVGADEVMEYLS